MSSERHPRTAPGASPEDLTLVSPQRFTQWGAVRQPAPLRAQVDPLPRPKARAGSAQSPHPALLPRQAHRAPQVRWAQGNCAPGASASGAKQGTATAKPGRPAPRRNLGPGLRSPWQWALAGAAVPCALALLWFLLGPSPLPRAGDSHRATERAAAAPARPPAPSLAPAVPTDEHAPRSARGAGADAKGSVPTGSASRDSVSTDSPTDGPTDGPTDAAPPVVSAPTSPLAQQAARALSMGQRSRALTAYRQLARQSDVYSTIVSILERTIP